MVENDIHKSEMTARDCLAMAAMAGLISQHGNLNRYTVPNYASLCAANAYEMADAMLAERSKTTTKPGEAKQ